AAGTLQSRIVTSLTAGSTILIRIAGANDSRPTGSLSIATFTPLQGDAPNNPLAAVDGVNTYDTTQAVVNGFAGACTGFRDVYYTYTPTIRGGLRVSVCGQPTEANIAIIDPVGGATVVCSAFGTCFSGTAVEANVPVLIRIANELSTGPEQFTVIVDPLLIPANDVCSAPVAVSIGNTNFDNTYAFTDSTLLCPGVGGGFFGPGLDLWYSFTPAVSGLFEFSTALSEGISDTYLAVFTDCGLDPIACNDDFVGFRSLLRTQLVGGQTYLVRVSGTGSPANGTPVNRGAGVLSVRQSIAPPNDDCTGATLITQPITAYDLFDATTDATPAVCLLAQFTTKNDAWFRYVPTQSGPLEARLVAGGAAGYLAVYSSCTDTAPLPAGLLTDTVSGGVVLQRNFVGQAGVPVFVRIAFLVPENDPFPTVGTGDLYVGPPTIVVPVNDDCSAATPIVHGVPVSIDLNNSVKDCTTVRLCVEDIAIAASINDIYYRYTATATETVVISVTDGLDYPEFGGLVVSVYSGCGGERVGTNIGCGDAPQGAAGFDAIAGQEYIVRVGTLGFSTPVYTGSIVIGTLVRCSPADIAYDDGSPLPPTGVFGGTNNGVTEADYNIFFANFFDAGLICDIANDDGSPLPPFGALTTNNDVTEGDYNLFFSIYFNGCP
ncbi:MAG: hypothetical protein K2X32_06260, partial [Phycisphaerales bacterium]|nr:hypothetical protein [Phycisphaerales bacterium]